jgi:hypothetical protein
MYRRKRLTLESLRQITKEYLRGGPFRQTFSIELLPDELEIADKKQQVHKVHENTKSINNAHYDLLSQPKLDAQQATRLADSLLVQQKQQDKNYSYNKIKYGVLIGVVVAFILLFFILSV